MQRKQDTEEQIGFVLRQAEAGTPIGEVCRKAGISEQTFYRWTKKFAGMGVAEIRRLKQLEEENRRLKFDAEGLCAPSSRGQKNRIEAGPTSGAGPCTRKLTLEVDRFMGGRSMAKRNLTFQK